MAVQRLNCLDLLNKMNIAYESGEFRIIGNSNPTLLINGDFRSSYRINQRGASGVISAAGYFIDMWQLVSGTVELLDAGLKLNGTIKQIREFAVGQITTASVKMVSGTATATYNDSNRTFTITSSGGVVERAKLEAGNVSTINSDPPADYGVELMKCYRYLQKIENLNANSYVGVGTAYNATTCYCALPIMPMRATPTATLLSGTFFVGNMGVSGASNVTSIRVYGGSGNNLYPYTVYLTGTFTAGQTAAAWLRSGTLLFSAELY